MADSQLMNDLRVLAGNLASLWNGGRDVLDRLVAAGDDPRAAPWGALRRLGPEGAARVFAGDERTVVDAFGELTRYLAGETWFDRTCAPDAALSVLRDRPVAYFCMEYGLANWLPIYSGGLGILAGDVLKEASDLGLPMVAVGLFYQHGFFFQHLDEHAYQTESVPTLDPADLPMDLALDTSGQTLVVSIPIADRTVHVRVWKLQVGRVPLYLLDTDFEANDRPQDRAITASLYGGDQETRIQQELVLGVAGLRALHALGIEPSVHSMNEGHAAFLGLELLAETAHDEHMSVQDALAHTRCRVVYTNHTVVPAGNDTFPRDLVSRYLDGFAAEVGIPMHDIIAMGTRGQDDWFSMAELAFRISGKANGVSELHAQVVPREWPGYNVEAVTNGVHVPTWLGAEMRALLDEYVPDWQADQPDWTAIHRIPDDRLWAARQAQRAVMVEFVNGRQDRVRLDPDALTIAWARRFAEYKRAWLIASDLERLKRIMTGDGRPVQIVIAGKAHPRDEGGKRMLQGLMERLTSDPEVAERVVFVEDYDERVARYLTLGADVWLNTPRKPLEASGTSGMKSSDNGGLQLTVADGWAAEVDWWGVGWGVAGTSDEADAAEVYGFLEGGVLPSFYQRDGSGVPAGWTAMMKNTMIITLSRYSARRMLLDYLRKLYLPLLEETFRLRV